MESCRNTAPNRVGIHSQPTPVNHRPADAKTPGMTTPNFGVARFSQLLDTGLTRQHVDELVSVGRLVRVRRGWYALPSAHPDAVRAVAAGGALTCVSALGRHGVWVPPTSDLHLRTSEHHRSTTLQPGMKRCRRGRAAPRYAVDPLPVALIPAMACLDDEGVVVVLDSVRNLRLLTLQDLMAFAHDQSERVRRLLSLTVSNSQSGTESMVRYRLWQHRVRARPQVTIPGVGRVDLLVGDRLVLEMDSHAHHTGIANYTRDRERDRALVRLGYLVVRLTYHQVVSDWEAVWPDLQSLIRTERHRWTRRIRFSEPA